MAAKGVTYVEPLADLPLIVLEVDLAQLDALIASGMVEAVQEDHISHAIWPRAFLSLMHQALGPRAPAAPARRWQSWIPV